VMLGLGRTWRESDVVTLLRTPLKLMIPTSAIRLSIDFLSEFSGGELSTSWIGVVLLPFSSSSPFVAPYTIVSDDICSFWIPILVEIDIFVRIYWLRVGCLAVSSIVLSLIQCFNYCEVESRIRRRIYGRRRA
jgi:hypothetical protein